MLTPSITSQDNAWIENEADEYSSNVTGV